MLESPVLQSTRTCFHHVRLRSRTLLHEHIKARWTQINLFCYIGMDFLLCRSTLRWARLLVFQTRDLMLCLVYDGSQYLGVLNENVTLHNGLRRRTWFSLIWFCMEKMASFQHGVSWMYLFLGWSFCNFPGSTRRLSGCHPIAAFFRSKG